VDERQQATAGGGPFQTGALGHFGDRHARVLGVKALDNGKAANEAVDDIAVAHVRISYFVRKAHRLPPHEAL
jgi:hypothetical protein